MKTFSRRNFVRNLSGLALTPVISNSAAALLATPKQSAGPFYPDQMPLDDDNDLTQVKNMNRPAYGEFTDLSGKLLDLNGRHIPNALIEIWQCDINSRYRHSRDSGQKPVDPGFQGFGKTLTDSNGQYRFRTIRPVAYPGRTPHIHVAVFIGNQSPFVTQLYNENEPQNSQDFLYRSVPPELRYLITSKFEATAEADISYRANWDIVVGIKGI